MSPSKKDYNLNHPLLPFTMSIPKKDHTRNRLATAVLLLIPMFLFTVVVCTLFHHHPTEFPEFSISTFDISSPTTNTTVSFTLTALYPNPNDAIHYDHLTTTVIYDSHRMVDESELQRSPLSEFEGSYNGIKMQVDKYAAEGIRLDIGYSDGYLEFGVRAESDFMRVVCEGIPVGFRVVRACSGGEVLVGSMVGPLSQCKVQRRCYSTFYCSDEDDEVTG